MRPLATDGVLHITGIGGIGMSGLASILKSWGYNIQGSDSTENENVQRLRYQSIKVFSPQDAANVKDADYIIRSTAIPDKNVEIMEARKLKKPVLSRAELLSAMLKYRRTLSVAGSHGKTTTNTFLANIMIAAERDPLVINGGIMEFNNSNVVLGDGEIAVVEADESDGTFLTLPTDFAIITNIDDEHREHYKSFANICSSFRQFVQQLPFYGFAVVEYNSVQHLAGVENRTIVSYSVDNEKADFHATNVSYSGFKSNFELVYPDGSVSARCFINTSGKHNIANAIAAMILALHLGITEKTIIAALGKCSTPKRRFTAIGEFRGVTVIDDYAHHPKEIEAAISSAANIVDVEGAVVAVLQPHRFSRLKNYFNDYIEAVKSADHVLLMNVFAAGEVKEDYGVDSASLCKALTELGRESALVDAPKCLNDELLKLNLKQGSVILFMGAGDVTKWAKELILSCTFLVT